MTAAGRIAVAGAGIAGLTSALAFARHGFDVAVFERSEKFEEVGAGLQLSPNATRILARLGLLERLLPAAVKPLAITLRRADSLRELASVPLGDEAERRWRAPYLTIHRADLQRALLDAAIAQPLIDIRTGSAAAEVTRDSDRRPVLVLSDGRSESGFDLVIGADGAWSSLRSGLHGARASHYSGYLAWRATIDRPNGGTGWLPPRDRVTAFLHPGFHLVAYPLRGGELINLVAVTRSRETARGWSGAGDTARLAATMNTAAPQLQALVAMAGTWTTWPLHGVDPSGPWTDGAGLALVGDAAHAMTPFAAQGAGMAIEDAAALARLVAEHRADVPGALQRYERERKGRVIRVVKRGSFNRFVWHAAGPLALGRDLVLAARSGEALAGDMDWLYGYDEGSKGVRE